MLLTTTAECPRRAVVQRPTSALAHSRHSDRGPVTSGLLPLIADIGSGTWHAVSVARCKGRTLLENDSKLSRFQAASPNDRFAPPAANRKSEVMDVCFSPRS